MSICSFEIFALYCFYTNYNCVHKNFTHLNSNAQFVVPNLCPVAPPDEPAYYTGRTNQTFYTNSTMGCANGYMAASNGYPVYYCSPDNDSIGFYSQVSGDCIRTQFR